VYQHMDIGTAKPTPSLRLRVHHYLIDVTPPDDPMTLGRYLDLARAALDGTWSRGRLSVLAGGSGQYAWAMLEGWQVPSLPADEAYRAELEEVAEKHGAAVLHARLAEIDPVGAGRLDPMNVRRVVRALELVTRTGLPLSACQAREPLDADCLILGLRLDREELHRRIDARVDAMFSAGFVSEVEGLRARGWGETNAVRGGIGYKEVGAYLDGEISLAEAIERTKFATHRLVRNQHAWFKQEDPRISWIDVGEGAALRAAELVETWLAKPEIP